MPLFADDNLKLFYSINEVAEQFNVPPSTLRYWEKAFPQLHPTTNSRGVRQYTAADIEVLRVIHTHVKVRGFKIRAVQKMLAANPRGAEKNSAIITLLQGVRDELKEIRAQLDAIG